ncbi:DUF3160 domain-containing protein [Hymenobacter guriensis]|uniref:DUF3160 domain-containing protein n=1 Tax=Hymenobacter guriensis TaxID=2793065 RepID=A0ABS0L5M7_9BACT|nr:DUF3160 domain-containing protein [Hymenobacter guriensis]MBG8555427.1 DUF3160 domain-containing protein [Hymenobacter guriensis]
MNRTTWLALTGFALLLLGGGLFWWFRSANPAAPAAKTPASTSVSNAPTAGGSSTHDNGFGEQITIKQTEDKTWLAQYYQRTYIKGYYEGYATEEVKKPKRTPLPPFDFNQSLAGKSYLDLLLLRNTIYARNGYCFMNATARTYFDKQKWYYPLWAEAEYNEQGKEIRPVDDVIPVPLNKQELAFVQRVQAEEARLLARRISRQNGYDMLGFDFVTNQRELLTTPAMRTVLNRHNFVLVPTQEEQLFYIYDQNQYNYTPSFVTTDLVLQLLHKYLNGILSDVEEKCLAPVVASVLREGRQQAEALARRSQIPQARAAAEWAAAYYAVGQGLLQPGASAPTGTYADVATNELQNATAAEGKGSYFLHDSLYDYTALKPRGMYTLNDTTRRYFRTVKWLNTAPVFFDSDEGLLRTLALGQALNASAAGTRSFGQFSQVLDVLVGDEDNRSMTHLLQLLKTKYAGRSLDQLSEPATLASLRRQLAATGTDRIRAKGATDKAVEHLAKPKFIFTAGRYTFDGEILQRLVNVKRPRPQAKPPRPFPKGLDVFATFRNQTAQDLLLKHYQEAARWPAYPDSLRVLQQQFAGFKGWDQNLYTKTMQMLLALNAPTADKNPPLFARTPAWQKRNLSTALGGWTELKHDLILYTEQPMGAEAGAGGEGPPPPQHLGYVEPNLPFWNAALQLLSFQEQRLTRLGANTEHLAGINKEIRELVTKLRNMAQKEVNHQSLTNEEMTSLSWIGGEVESLTIRILKTAQLPDREKHIGLVADVYAFNQDVLEEAVGAVDALYVVVEINGTPVLARGAAFSYYEFVSDTRLTDEEWKTQLKRTAPARPTWLQELIVPVKELATKSGDPESIY